MQTKLSPGPGLSRREVAAHQTARIQAALVGVVSALGYEGLRVRDVVKEAGVSSKAFYERYGGKEDCFLQTYEMLAGRAIRRIVSAQAGEPDWRKRLRLIFDAFAGELDRQPAAGRLLLIEAYRADATCVERAWRAERLFDGMLAEALARPPGGVVVPPLLAEGMVGGFGGIARERLREGRQAELTAISSEVVGWALSYPGEGTQQLSSLDRGQVWRNARLEQLPEPSGLAVGSWLPTGDRALITAGAAKLAVAEGYERLTPARVCAAAGLPRRRFDEHFEGVEDCYVAAVEQSAGEALAQAARAQTAAATWAGGVYRAIAAFCEHVAGDALLASACMAEGLPPGSARARSRERFAAAVLEQLQDAVPAELRPSALVAEASAAAAWGVFHRHLVRDWVKRRQVSATLAYLVLAPILGSAATVEAIRAEQSA